MERYTLKVAVYMMLTKDDKIFLIRRFNTGWMDGNYTLPSGHLDRDETIVGAAIRETEEEAGVMLAPVDIVLVHTMHRMNRYIDFFYKADTWQGEPRNMEADKCDDARWFATDELPENIVPSVKSAIENFGKGKGVEEFQG